MASNYWKVKKGLSFESVATAVSVKGDVAYNSATDKLELYNGAVDPFVQEAKASTLTNKTLTTPTINGAALSGTLSGTPTFSGAFAAGSTMTGASSLTLGTSGGTRGSLIIVGTSALGPLLNFDNTAGTGGKMWNVGDGLSVANGTFEIRNTTDSKVVYQSDANGNTVILAKLGIIAASGASDQVSINGTTTLTGVTQRGIAVIMTGTSAGTTALTAFHSALTSAASTTVTLATGYRSASPTVGGSGTITRFNGFYDSGAQQHLATNNATFADNATYTGNWFINNSVGDPSTFAGVTSLATLKFGSAGTTGVTINTLGTNGPNVTTTPNTWVAIQLSDGSTGYMPVWK